MTRMTSEGRAVTGGVDTHADVHAAAVICSQTAQVLGTAMFATDPRGYVQLLAWLGSFGVISAVGVEGTGTYGAGLTRFLTAESVRVVEVDRPDRKARRQQGKSDPLDAISAARAVVSGSATTTPKSRDGNVEAIRALHLVYRAATRERTRAINQFRALLLTAPQPLRDALIKLPFDDQVARAMRWSDAHPDQHPLHVELRAALRELARRIVELSAQQQRLELRLRPLVEATAPALLDVVGVGVHTAARLLIAYGDNPHRIRNEAAFAHLCGVAPIPASSGKTVRHRLNRGGNRSANHALWRIAMVRLTCHPPTRDYVARRRAQGRSDREIMRCLKRYIAREIHRVITAPPPPAPRGPALRAQRTDLGLALRPVAAALGTSPSMLSRIERGTHHNADLQRRAHTWLTHQRA